MFLNNFQDTEGDDTNSFTASNGQNLNSKDKLNLSSFIKLNSD